MGSRATAPRVLGDETMGTIEDDLLCAIEEKHNRALQIVNGRGRCGEDADDLQDETDAAEVIADAGCANGRVDVGVDQQRRLLRVDGEMCGAQARDDGGEIVVRMAQRVDGNGGAERGRLRPEDVDVQPEFIFRGGARQRLQLGVDVLQRRFQRGGRDKAFALAEVAHVAQGVGEVEGRGRGGAVRARVERGRMRKIEDA